MAAPLGGPWAREPGAQAVPRGPRLEPESQQRFREAEFCDRDYGLDLGVCTAYAEYDFDDSEDANVARRDLYLERGCAAIDDGFYYFILAMCFLVGALVTFLAAACWIFDALQDQERKSRLRAGTCVVVVALVVVFA